MASFKLGANYNSLWWLPEDSKEVFALIFQRNAQGKLEHHDTRINQLRDWVFSNFARFRGVKMYQNTKLDYDEQDKWVKNITTILTKPTELLSDHDIAIKTDLSLAIQATLSTEIQKAMKKNPVQAYLMPPCLAKYHNKIHGLYAHGKEIVESVYYWLQSGNQEAQDILQLIMSKNKIVDGIGIISQDNNSMIFVELMPVEVISMDKVQQLLNQPVEDNYIGYYSWKYDVTNYRKLLISTIKPYLCWISATKTIADYKTFENNVLSQYSRLMLS